MDRIDEVVRRMEKGESCSQAMIATFGPELGLEASLGLRIGLPFSGGIGGMGEVCGALTGSLVVLGLLCDPGKPGAKDEAKVMARDFTEKFRALYGCLDCRELKAGAEARGESEGFCRRLERQTAELLATELSARMPSVRLAVEQDLPAIREIYNQGIADRVATLESEEKTEEDMLSWWQSHDEHHPVLVAETAGRVVGWAALAPFSARQCYRGVATFSVYIRREERGRGLGRLLLTRLEAVALEQGFHKMMLSALDSNTAGLKLYASRGFSRVGLYHRQGQLDGIWQDVVLMEKLLAR